MLCLYTYITCKESPFLLKRESCYQNGKEKTNCKESHDITRRRIQMVNGGIEDRLSPPRFNPYQQK